MHQAGLDHCLLQSVAKEGLSFAAQLFTAVIHFFTFHGRAPVLNKATAKFSDLCLKYIYQVYQTKQNKENQRQSDHYLEKLEVVTLFTEKQKEMVGKLVKSHLGPGNKIFD